MRILLEGNINKEGYLECPHCGNDSYWTPCLIFFDFEIIECCCGEHIIAELDIKLAEVEP